MYISNNLMDKIVPQNKKWKTIGEEEQDYEEGCR